MPSSSALHQAYRFKSGIVATNRIVMAPLTNMQSPTTLLSEDEYNWLKRRIEGGFSIVTTCAAHVMKTAQAWPGELGIFSEDHLPGFEKLASVGSSHQALVIPQLFHGGFRCPSELTGVQPVSASEFNINTPGFEKPRALTTSEILDIKSHFVAAARRAIRAGLPGVEVHGANGYLFTQFLSPYTNRRTDKWGGSLENRSRFLLETVAEIRRAIGPDKIIGVRISPENTKLIPEIKIAEMIEVAHRLHDLGVDYISLSLWDSRKKPDENPQSEKSVVRLFREALPATLALTASGKIWTLADALATHEDGADFVVLGGAAIANPEWPREILNDEFTPRRFPLSPKQFEDVSVSPAFVNYLTRWGFVTEGTP